MRAIDVDRKRAMNEIKVRARSILSMADEYERMYKDNSYPWEEQRANLEDIWRIITENNVVLTNTLRENGL
jgi:hypothetical protein